MARSNLTRFMVLACVGGVSVAAWNHSDYLYSPAPEEIPNRKLQTQPVCLHDSSQAVAPATGSDWEEAFAKASTFVSQLTLEEKVSLVSGTEGPCVGNIAPIPRLSFTGLCIQNGPLALEQGTYSSVFPAGLTIAATWDKNIAYQRGHQLGEEFKGKGSHIILGPVAGPLGRAALGGRNWEGFSPDPYLTGSLFAESITGIQNAGVQACAKHYIGNEQETQRQPSNNDNGTRIESVSANIDDRTLHELYLWPFQQAVKAGVATVSGDLVSMVMCSYNRINQTYGCQNSKLLNGILKGELGFQGPIISDWGATHSGALAANSGEDMDMPGTASFGTVFFHQNLTDSVNNGSVSTGRLDDMCRRVMTPYYHLEQDKKFPAIDPSMKDTNAVLFSSPNEYSGYTYGNTSNVDVRANHRDSIRKAAAAGTVLLKNLNKTLPLKSPTRIGVFGNDAGDFTNGMSYWYFNQVGNYEYGVLATGGGSGSGLFTYVTSPLEAIKRRVGYKDEILVQYVLNNSAIIEDDSPYIKALQPFPPDVCLVFLKSWATEGEDRTTFGVDWNGDQVVETIAANCSNTIVITHSGGINTMPWADHPNVTAILAAHLPGQEAGDSIVDILWGDVNPSGRLPYTIAKEADDYSFAPITNSTALQDTNDPLAWQSDFEEGLLIDYRHFDYYNKSVQYEFGFGLSYTTFDISNNISVKSVGGDLTAIPPTTKIIPGGNPHLWDKVYQISVILMNTGPEAGEAVAQLYLGIPQSGQEKVPLSALRGFEKVYLEPGQSTTVIFDLTRRDISHWDVARQQWVIGDEEITARAGFSSRNLPVSTSFAPLSHSSDSGREQNMCVQHS
ncbi:hypothetical protein E4T49_06194 [Aureobasidium sp. EXF-10728]|nr:hypothetical protein E4T49_06194 [Aureobasidium sp. EXF-10728]